MDLWPRVRHHFEDDDGSLPGVGLAGLTGPQVVEVCQFLCSIGTLAPDAKLWDRTQGVEASIDGVPSAAALVVSGEAEPWHALLTDIHHDGQSVPDLGMFVSPDSIFLDYRRGSPWGPASAAAFFSLLRAGMVKAPQAHLEFDSEFGDHASGLDFLDAWSSYLQWFPLSPSQHRHSIGVPQPTPVGSAEIRPAGDPRSPQE